MFLGLKWVCMEDNPWPPIPYVKAAQLYQDRLQGVAEDVHAAVPRPHGVQQIDKTYHTIEPSS